jgi:hypothetical protein
MIADSRFMDLLEAKPEERWTSKLEVVLNTR